MELSSTTIATKVKFYRSFYKRETWKKFFSDLLIVAKKCHFFPRGHYHNTEEKRALMMNAYKEAMYFASYPVCGVSNEILSAYIAYVDLFDRREDGIDYSLDFKKWLVDFYNKLSPYFENKDMTDDDWEAIIKIVSDANKSSGHNPLACTIWKAVLSIVEYRWYDDDYWKEAEHAERA